MAKYEIGINIKATSSKTGLGRLPTRGAMTSTTREDMMRVQEIKKGLSKAGLQDPKSKLDKQLVTSLGRLDKTLLKLDKNIGTLSQGMRAGGIGAGAGRAAGGIGRGMGGGMRGGGLGRVGAAAGLLGVPIAALAFVTSKIMEVGRSSIAKVMEQQGTAGVGGFQTSGRYTGIFSAAEFGQYMKARRTAAGSFAPSASEYKGRSVYNAPLGMQMGAIYGNLQEAGTAAGLLGIAARPAGRTGEQDLSAIIAGTFRQTKGGVQGVGPELPLLMRELISNMEDAVKEGVNASDLAKDMAKEVVSFARVVPGGQIRTAMQIQRSLMGVQKQAARGPGNVPEWRMHVAARELIQGEGIQSQRIQGKLIEAGFATPQTIEAAKQRKLGHNELTMMILAVNQMSTGVVRERMMGDIVTRIGGEGTVQQRAARLSREGMRGNILAPLELTPTRALAYVSYFDKQKAKERRRASLLEKKARLKEALLKSTGLPQSELTGLEVEALSQIDKEISGLEKAPPGTAFTKFQARLKETAVIRKEKRREGAKERLKLGPTGALARDTVNIVETSMIRLADTMSKPVNNSINLVNKSLIGLAKGGVLAAQLINSAVQKTIKSVTFLDNLLSGTTGGQHKMAKVVEQKLKDLSPGQLERARQYFMNPAGVQ